MVIPAAMNNAIVNAALCGTCDHKSRLLFVTNNNLKTLNVLCSFIVSICLITNNKSFVFYLAFACISCLFVSYYRKNKKKQWLKSTSSKFRIIRPSQDDAVNKKTVISRNPGTKIMRNICSDSACSVGNLQDVSIHLQPIDGYDRSLFPILCMQLLMRYLQQHAIVHKGTSKLKSTTKIKVPPNCHCHLLLCQ